MHSSFVEFVLPHIAIVYNMNIDAPYKGFPVIRDIYYRRRYQGNYLLIAINIVNVYVKTYKLFEYFEDYEYNININKCVVELPVMAKINMSRKTPVWGLLVISSCIIFSVLFAT